MKKDDPSPLRAVHDDDLDTLLESLKLSRDLEAGRLRCRVCGTQMTRENLLALLPDYDAISLVCSNPACLKGILRASHG